jgi:hypothetical protein
MRGISILSESSVLLRTCYIHPQVPPTSNPLDLIEGPTAPERQDSSNDTRAHLDGPQLCYGCALKAFSTKPQRRSIIINTHQHQYPARLRRAWAPDQARGFDGGVCLEVCAQGADQAHGFI